MKELDKYKVGLIVGLFLGLVHLLWAVLVAVGMAQPLLDFVYGIHFLNNPFTVATFNLMTAAILVVVTFVVGYVGGWVFSALWGWAIKKK